VSPKRMKQLETLKDIFGGNNYAGLRTEMGSVDPPLIPFFGMYLTDITFIEEGSPDFLTVQDVNLINFGKRYDECVEGSVVDQASITLAACHLQPDGCKDNRPDSAIPRSALRTGRDCSHPSTARALMAPCKKVDTLFQGLSVGCAVLGR